jgi:hypothetical protein
MLEELLNSQDGQTALVVRLSPDEQVGPIVRSLAEVAPEQRSKLTRERVFLWIAPFGTADPDAAAGQVEILNEQPRGLRRP